MKKPEDCIGCDYEKYWKKCYEAAVCPALIQLILADSERSIVDTPDTYTQGGYTCN